MVIALIFLAAILAMAFLPQMWVRRVIADHAGDRPDLPGSGAEMARNMLDRLGLTDVAVEQTDQGDHYDPEAKAVRLSKENFEGRSLTALVIAAHEIGHAMQDATGYGPLAARQRLARRAMRAQQLGTIVMLASPLLFILMKSPVAILIEVVAALFIMSFAILIHAVTLPVELDASFRRAMPLLEATKWMRPEDQPAAKRILRAAAFTYVAAAAMTLLDVARWMRVLRM
jgi:Zn-dependent membrane protease YugP